LIPDWASFRPLVILQEPLCIKSFYTQQHCYVSLQTLYPGRIQTQVFSFLRRMRCPLRHAAISFWKIQNCSIILDYFYPRKKFNINFDKKWDGPHFGRFFHKLIWSPCNWKKLIRRLH
jgi:hypothetical protein